MPNTAIWLGRLLVLIGIAGYAYGMYVDGNASLTSLIPAGFGLVLMVLGHVSRAKEPLRKHLMHAAAAIALLGFILTAGRLVMNLSRLTLSAAVLAQVAMAIVCLIFVILAVRSFAAARRARVAS